MRVILVCINDWANIAYTYSQAFQTVGMESLAFSVNRHRFDYPEQALPYDKEIVKRYASDADVVIFANSYYLDLGINLKDKLVCVTHVGTDYRQKWQQLNKIFNPIVDITFVGGDMLNRGGKNEVWCLGAIDVKKIKPVYRTKFNKKIIVGHYPSNIKTKGTQRIVKAMAEIQENNFIFKCNTTKVSWVEQIKRMSDCDIYIEQFLDKQGKQPLFVFGITALESALLGKVICTRFPMIEEYEKIFGKCPIFSIVTSKHLQKTILKLSKLSGEQFLVLQKNTREWVERCHSFEVVGGWFKEIFERELKKKRK